jgi:hypothetical protein
MSGQAAPGGPAGDAFAPFGARAGWAATVRIVARALADGYGLRVVGEVRHLDGTFKRNLLVRAARSGSALPADYVVHVHRPFITAARVATVHRAVRSLARSDLPVPRPVATTSGDTRLRVEGHVVDVDPYVASDAIADTWPRFAAAARLLARIHDTLAAGAAIGRAPRVPPPVRLYGTPADARDTPAGLAARLREAVAAYDAGSSRPLTAGERAALAVQLARVPLYDLAEVGSYVDPRLAGPVQAVLRLSPQIERAEWLVGHRDRLATLLRAGGPPEP